MLKYNRGRFYIGKLSFEIPDNMFLTTVYEMEIENGFELFSEDKKVRLMIGGNEIAESALESIESIFDEECTYRKASEITELHKAGLDGCYVVYENDTVLNIEACLNTPELEEAHTFTVWAHTKKENGEETVARMMSLYNQLLDSIRVDT